MGLKSLKDLLMVLEISGFKVNVSALHVLETRVNTFFLYSHSTNSIQALMTSHGAQQRRLKDNAFPVLRRTNCSRI